MWYSGRSLDLFIYPQNKTLTLMKCIVFVIGSAHSVVTDYISSHIYTIKVSKEHLQNYLMILWFSPYILSAMTYTYLGWFVPRWCGGSPCEVSFIFMFPTCMGFSLLPEEMCFLEVFLQMSQIILFRIELFLWSGW